MQRIFRVFAVRSPGSKVPCGHGPPSDRVRGHLGGERWTSCHDEHVSADDGTSVAEDAESVAANDGTIRVFLLDDHEVVRAGVAAALDNEPDLQVVGEAGDAVEALRVVADTQPDVAVLDVRLGDGTSGVEVCRQITDRHPDVRSLILTSFDDDKAVVDAAAAGAAGFVLKQIRSNELIDAIRN